ncbi:AraC family transcriptional regulator [Halalkalibacter krulwichiae]|nr:helix-turn-helix domain-containing protein [Halalkalibacter krulwichiae]
MKMKSQKFLDVMERIKKAKTKQSNLIEYKQDLAGEERTFFSEEPGILFVLSGELEYQIGETNFILLKQGEYLFYPKGVTVQLEIENGCSSLLLPLTKSITESFIQLLEEYRGFSPRLLEVPKRVCIMQETWSNEIDKLLIDMLEKYLENNDFFIHLYACEVMYHIFPNEYMLSKISYILDMFYYPESIRMVEAFLLQNYQRPLRVRNIVEKVNVSESQLNRLYKRYFQQSPMERLTEIRMEQAALLLKNQSITVTEAAGQVGYQSMSAFVQQFKKKFGVSPKDYQLSGNR